MTLQQRSLFFIRLVAIQCVIAMKMAELINELANIDGAINTRRDHRVGTIENLH
jgi:hypothetical protein